MQHLDGRRAPRGRALRQAGALGITVVVAVAGITWVVGDQARREATREARRAELTAPLPDTAEVDVVAAVTAWDPRVEPFASYVAGVRGLAWAHPVGVDFLPEAGFVAALHGGRERDAEVDPEEVAALDATVGTLRALGVAAGHLDLARSAADQGDATTLGFYAWDDGRIRVRGDELTPAVQVTLVHELVHALQDQHFDLAALHAGVASEPEQQGLLALLEGDAEHVATVWAEERGIDPDAIDPEVAAGLARPTWPELLGLQGALPYEAGPALVRVLVGAGGPRAVDDAFARPPVSELQVIDPASYLRRADPVRLDAPELDRDDEAVAGFVGDEIGALSWYLVLAARLAPLDAWQVAQGWVGDSTTTFRRGTTTCVRSSVATLDRTARERWHDGLSRWAAAGPAGGDGEVAVVGGLVRLTTCDPGPDAPGPSAGFTSAARLPLSRLWLIASLSSRYAVDAATCIADRSLADAAVQAEVLADEPETPAFDAAISDPQLRVACGVG